MINNHYVGECNNYSNILIHKDNNQSYEGENNDI